MNSATQSCDNDKVSVWLSTSRGTYSKRGGVRAREGDGGWAERDCEGLTGKIAER